ncbi:MAG: inositol monophosphatase [Pseudohongiella sp.]|jgi:myo-inositol-1(or 4)-monophosphatase|nr:inositol monophosphatase [Pseudohongiella sp.]
MHPLVNIALQAVRDAAEALAHSSDRLDRVKIINDDPAAFLTSMDLEAEKTIFYHLEKAYPEHTFHSRASGIREGSNKDIVWLIDPLLGNRNFVTGYTQFGVSVACQVEGIIQHAVISCPLLREEFIASRGSGVRMNAQRLRVGSRTEIKDSLISLNLDGATGDIGLAMQGEIMQAGASPRISGCTALDLVQTASNRTQGGWAPNEANTTLAAAKLILQEAGGLLGNETGSPELNAGKELIFGNPKIFKQLARMRQTISD